MKKHTPLMLCIALFMAVTAVAFVDDKGGMKATKAQARNGKHTHGPVTDTAKRTHSPITAMDATTKATKK